MKKDKMALVPMSLPPEISPAEEELANQLFQMVGEFVNKHESVEGATGATFCVLCALLALNPHDENREEIVHGLSEAASVFVDVNRAKRAEVEAPASERVQ
jgi:hypothetical protein